MAITETLEEGGGLIPVAEIDPPPLPHETRKEKAKE
jgi:hypothetical protein